MKSVDAPKDLTGEGDGVAQGKETNHQLDNTNTSVVSPIGFYLVHLNMALYAFAWWLNQPVLPYLSKSLGADNVMFGYLQSFNMFVQLIGAPLIGRLIDLRGAKVGLLVSHGVATLSYGLLSTANSIPMLFASQVPTIFMAAMHSSQAYITLLSTPEERAKQIGRVSLSYGVGFVFGPIVGGTLTKYIPYSSIALIACAISATVWIILFVFLPNVQSSPKLAGSVTPAVSAASAPHASSGSSGLAVARLLKIPSVRTIILIKFLLGTALAVYRTSFSLTARDHFGLDAQQHGFILSGVGGITMVVNVFVIGWLTARWSESYIVIRCIAIVGVAFLLSAFAAFSLTALLVYLVPMTVAGAVAATILTSSLTKLSSLGDAGSVLGLDMSIGTASRVLAPTIGGWLLLLGYEFVGGVAAAVTILAWSVAVFTHQIGADATKATVATELARDSTELEPLTHTKKDN